MPLTSVYVMSSTHLEPGRRISECQQVRTRIQTSGRPFRARVRLNELAEQSAEFTTVGLI